MEPALPQDESLSPHAFGRLVAILDVFAKSPTDAEGTGVGTRSLGVSEVSRALGLAKGTVSRYLYRMATAGILERLPDGRYALSTRVFHWGEAARPAVDVRVRARPEMMALAESFGETVSLFVLEGGTAVCIEQVDGRRPVRLSAAVGRSLPLHTGASPRLLLAHAPDEVQEAFLAAASFPRLTPHTITEAAELRRANEEARRLGYVVSESECDEDAVGVAAPIWDGAKRVCASLSIAGPATRFVGERRDAIVGEVQTAAGRISRALGYIAQDAG